MYIASLAWYIWEYSTSVSDVSWVFPWVCRSSQILTSGWDWRVLQVTSYHNNISTFRFNLLTTLPFEERLLASLSTLSSVTFSDPKGILFFFSSSKMAAYSRRAPNTMMMQTTRYRSIAFRLDEMGASALWKQNCILSQGHRVYLTLLKMLMRTRNNVTKRAILEDDI